MKRGLVWFTEDLRVDDNETLLRAIAENDEIVNHLASLKVDFKPKSRETVINKSNPTITQKVRSEEEEKAAKEAGTETPAAEGEEGAATPAEGEDTEFKL